jgi:hypothetical protein
MYTKRESSRNPNSNTLEPDRPYHDRSAVLSPSSILPLPSSRWTFIPATKIFQHAFSEMLLFPVLFTFLKLPKSGSVSSQCTQLCHVGVTVTSRNDAGRPQYACKHRLDIILFSQDYLVPNVFILIFNLRRNVMFTGVYTLQHGEKNFVVHLILRTPIRTRHQNSKKCHRMYWSGGGKIFNSTWPQLRISALHPVFPRNITRQVLCSHSMNTE